MRKSFIPSYKLSFNFKPLPDFPLGLLQAFSEIHYGKEVSDLKNYICNIFLVVFIQCSYEKT